MILWPISSLCCTAQFYLLILLHPTPPSRLTQNLFLQIFLPNLLHSFWYKHQERSNTSHLIANKYRNQLQNYNQQTLCGNPVCRKCDTWDYLDTYHFLCILIHSRQISVRPWWIWYWTLSLDVATSAWTDNTAHTNVSPTPATAL